MNNKGYINIQGWMINEHKLRGNELILYALIFGFSQDGISEFYGSSRYVSNALGLSRQSVMKLFRKLIDKKLIEISKESHYRVVKKVYHGGKESLPVGGKESLPNIYNTNNNNINNKEHLKNAPNPLVKKSSKVSFKKEFDIIWELYNFKKDKKKSQTKFFTLMKNSKEHKKLFNEIQKGIEDYLLELKRENWRQQQRLIFWLNAERWNDDYQVSKEKVHDFNK